MKTSGLLVALAVILAVLGAGLSYSGYNESLRVLTVTNTQSYTSTSTMTMASTRTEFAVVTTSSALLILDQVIDIRGIEGTVYAGYYDGVSATLDAGKVHVSYDSEGGVVDFWMLTEAQFTQFEARRNIEPGMPFVVQRLYSRSYDFTQDLQTSGTYYFIFMNKNKGAVSITLHVDAGMQTSVLTRTEEHVSYLTEATPFVTETVSFNSYRAGFGPLLYSGIGLVVVAVVLLIIGRMKGATRRSAQVSAETAAAPVAPVVSPPPPESARGKFCVNCGAALPEHATFCNKCGTKQ